MELWGIPGLGGSDFLPQNLARAKVPKNENPITRLGCDVDLLKPN